MRYETAQHQRSPLFLLVLELCWTLKGRAPRFICPLPRRPSWASGPRPLCTVQHCRLILSFSLPQLLPPFAGFDFFLFPQAFFILSRPRPRLLKSCPCPHRVLVFLYHSFHTPLLSSFHSSSSVASAFPFYSSEIRGLSEWLCCWGIMCLVCDHAIVSWVD